MDNQLAHPYHGSVYLGSARASGYGFWGSLPYVAAGSATWELFFENVQPSLNDFINTTLGGMALGEVTFRLSSVLSSHPAKGAASLGRQVGSFALSPIARVQQAVMAGTDQMAERHPPSRPSLIIGALHDRGGPVPVVGAERGFVELGLEYGSPFDESATKPYDAFQLRLQLSRGPTEVINRFEISGLLARHDVRRPGRSQLVLGLFQHYDYYDGAPFEFGSQSLSGAVLYRRSLGSRAQFNLGAHVETVLLGAISSDHGNYFRRDYDYGPGAGARLSASLRREGRDLLHVEQRIMWLHSLYGAEASHLITSSRLGAAIPLGRMVHLGGDVGLMRRHSSYREFSSKTRLTSQVRLYLLWSPF
jgi:hypothetical protein